ncbi:uncharacterized protein LOC135313220 [Phalacrocorax carbo]|uniref:uncharacterized protein LOC135313220 n=1 Tax=Phalacrocorax carbo TaxID=9209 RepID=UPI003119C190
MVAVEPGAGTCGSSFLPFFLSSLLPFSFFLSFFLFLALSPPLPVPSLSFLFLETLSFKRTVFGILLLRVKEINNPINKAGSCYDKFQARAAFYKLKKKPLREKEKKKSGGLERGLIAAGLSVSGWGRRGRAGRTSPPAPRRRSSRCPGTPGRRARGISPLGLPPAASLQSRQRRDGQLGGAPLFPPRRCACFHRCQRDKTPAKTARGHGSFLRSLSFLSRGSSEPLGESDTGAAVALPGRWEVSEQWRGRRRCLSSPLAAGTARARLREYPRRSFGFIFFPRGGFFSLCLLPKPGKGCDVPLGSLSRGSPLTAPTRRHPRNLWILLPGGGFSEPRSGTATGARRDPARERRWAGGGGRAGAREGAGAGTGRRHRSLRQHGREEQPPACPLSPGLPCSGGAQVDRSELLRQPPSSPAGRNQTWFKFFFFPPNLVVCPLREKGDSECSLSLRGRNGHSGRPCQRCESLL